MVNPFCIPSLFRQFRFAGMTKANMVVNLMIPIERCPARRIDADNFRIVPNVNLFQNLIFYCRLHAFVPPFRSIMRGKVQGR